MDGPVAPPPYRTAPVSFTRRGGRLTERQQQAWDDAAERYVVQVPRFGPSTSVDPAWTFDPVAAFGREAPLIVEIGSGRGEALAHAAQNRPDVDFLGLEVYVPGVAQTIVTLRHHGTDNARLAIVNAAEALSTMLQPASVHELWVFFPDPWHKKRHNKRRLVTHDFAQLAAHVLEPGGVWRFATDWDDYAVQAAEVLTSAPGFRGSAVERFDGRVMTRFERKGIEAGRAISDLMAVREA